MLHCVPQMKSLMMSPCKCGSQWRQNYKFSGGREDDESCSSVGRTADVVDIRTVKIEVQTPRPAPQTIETDCVG